MTDRKKVLILRIINILFFAFLIGFQYNGIFSINILTANPMLPLALLVACCMFASEITSVLSGLIAGIFIDCVASTPTGFNTILFMLLALSVSLIAKHLFNNNILATFALSLMCSVAYFIIRWIFCIAFSLDFAENLTYLMQYALPSSVYTAVLTIPLYFIEKYLYNIFYFLNYNK